MRNDRYRSESAVEGESVAVALAVWRLGWSIAGMAAMLIARAVFG